MYLNKNLFITLKKIMCKINETKLLLENIYWKTLFKENFSV